MSRWMDLSLRIKHMFSVLCSVNNLDACIRSHLDHLSISADDFVRLSALSDSDHDVLWLTLMIDHHQGAVEISSKALSGARSVLVARIAESTRVTQIREIAVMQELLAQLMAERLEN